MNRNATIRQALTPVLERVIRQLCGGSDFYDKAAVRTAVLASIAFPNKTKKTVACTNNGFGSPAAAGDDVGGKPHDVEVRIALLLFHQWRWYKSLSSALSSSSSSSLKAVPAQLTPPTNGIAITSDLGVTRGIGSPRELADLLCLLLEEEFRLEHNPAGANEDFCPIVKISPDVRSLPSGVLCLWTKERVLELRKGGRVPCTYPHCVQWCRGAKGLWWHQQQHHRMEHADATAVAAAAASCYNGAMVVYREKNDRDLIADKFSTIGQSENTESDNNPLKTKGCDRGSFFDPMQSIKDGDLKELQRALKHFNRNGDSQKNLSFDASTYLDPKGATPLMWAAGGGHLDIVRYLVEECHCDPRRPQKGKRSFSGRTALHWAARNGHLEVVRYLVPILKHMEDVEKREKMMDESPSSSSGLEAATQDGTTAFGWACWQRHLSIMEYLYEQRCNIHVINSFGCNAVLWCAQGSNTRNDQEIHQEGENGCGNDGIISQEYRGLKALRWLQSRGCDMTLVNHNGHGVLHKSAQRGQQGVAEWFMQEYLTENVDSSANAEQYLALVGPDTEGYCPSDLAGMEGHETMARKLAGIEMELCRKLGRAPRYTIPDGFSVDMHVDDLEVFCWEKYGGIRRMRMAIKQPRGDC